MNVEGDADAEVDDLSNDALGRIKDGVRLNL